MLLTAISVTICYILYVIICYSYTAICYTLYCYMLLYISSSVFRAKKFDPGHEAPAEWPMLHWALGSPPWNQNMDIVQCAISKTAALNKQKRDIVFDSSMMFEKSCVQSVRLFRDCIPTSTGRKHCGTARKGWPCSLWASRPFQFGLVTTVLSGHSFQPSLPRF